MALAVLVSLESREGFVCEVPQCSAGLVCNFPGFDPGLFLDLGENFVWAW